MVNGYMISLPAFIILPNEEPFMLIRRHFRIPVALLLPCLLALSLPMPGTALPTPIAPTGSIIPAAASPAAAQLTTPATPDQKHENNLTVPLALLGAGLLVMPFDHSLSNDMKTTHTDNATSFITHFGEPIVLVPVIGSLYLLGGKGEKTTARLAADALINSTLLTEVVKSLAGRARPTVAGKAGNFTGPSVNDKYASFPSGHTSAAFAVARVMAKRHPKEKWLYYGLAAAVGYARIRESEHFPSDVLAGAAIGIFSADEAMKHNHNFLTIRF